MARVTRMGMGSRLDIAVLSAPEVTGVDVLPHELEIVEELALVLSEVRDHLQEVLEQGHLGTAPGCS